MQAASYTKGGSGPSGVNADCWRRILCSSAKNIPDVADSVGSLQVCAGQEDGIEAAVL